MTSSRASKPRPTASQAAGVASPPREASRRLTLDIPDSLHFAMRMRSAETGVPMVDEVTPLLLEHYAEAMRRYPRS